MADHDDHCWFPVAVRENEEVVPVNVSTGVDDLPPDVARLVLPLVETAVPEWRAALDARHLKRAT